MINQNTFKNDAPTVYLVGTPIGNLDDFSYRAISILKTVDVIFCEDTRTSKTLFKKYQIDKPLISLNKVNEVEKIDQIIKRLENHQNIAIVSDAGAPIISDPGAIVISKIRALNPDFNVTAINVGPAYIHALVIAGYTNISNLFYGFIRNKNLKAKKEELQQVLNKYSNDHLIVFYESVHRIKDTIKTLMEINPHQDLMIARELTKINEQIIQGNIVEVNDFIQSEAFVEKGEFVLVLDVNKHQNLEMNDPQLLELVEKYLNEGYKLKRASEMISDLYDLKKNEIYNKYIKMKKNS
ncbi:16S rRNA (cytidine1402-2'-O)-methyltransferase [Williamsoniiplasma luminosum]|uniref:16S rRNA (Cytidine1402-2'-O)-methyltransferase n=1 Tax=Williamsoniiplasma luminosum TaxID=214888 RepID=A0A2K8NUP3_9MOLU|nr:16S rRNA (cytidine(1402)-2'-O)-methyltransferase [Williamsoniiplasma luminosum]ATZ17484.1 16S rRNA (cytidine1402-2'-O)-methyltransferase [Williamsoniiplasma luminosum]